MSDTQEKSGPQRILVIQQDGRGENKVRGIIKYGGDLFTIEFVTVESGLPPVIDDSSEYLPAEIDADLVLDYLKHPDLSDDLAAKCAKKNIPVVATGKKMHRPGVASPPICCALAQQESLGDYGRRFGAPELEVIAAGGKVISVEVLRGAPCGATWEAAQKIIGLPIAEADIRYGLETQMACTADPSAWDPIWGHSPVHLAAEIHQAAFKRGLKDESD